MVATRVQKGDAALVEEMLETRAWALVHHRLSFALEGLRELNENDKAMPEAERYMMLGRISALKMALNIPAILTEEARNLK